MQQQCSFNAEIWQVTQNNPHTCVRAEHSTYLTALSTEASFSPLSGCRGRCLFFASFSIVLLSSRRSTCVPTIRKGVRGQWCEISGTHCRRWSTHHFHGISRYFYFSSDHLRLNAVQPSPVAAYAFYLWSVELQVIKRLQRFRPNKNVTVFELFNVDPCEDIFYTTEINS